MIYRNNGKKYKVGKTSYDGALINVNGTTITDMDKMARLTNDKYWKPCGAFTVFCNSDELVFSNFEEAYNFAMNEQKDTFLIEKN